MALITTTFRSFDEYLAMPSSDLPEGCFEYWDGELIAVMSESGFNDLLANYLLVLLMNAGIPLPLLRPHSCEVAVPGNPKTRYPDLTILDAVHIPLIERRNTITRQMPPPRVLVEVVSPGDESSDNYIRDYREKPSQYAAIGVPEMWRIDPDRAWVQVGTLITGKYNFTTFRGEETIVSPTFPNLNLTAIQVLSAGR
jgi:Uma2 family endonuclease